MRALIVLGLVLAAARAGAQPAVGNCVGAQLLQDGAVVGCMDQLDLTALDFTVTQSGTRSAVVLAPITTALYLPAAACVNGTAAAAWDVPTSDAPVAACATGTNTLKGILNFDDGTGTGITAPSIQSTFMLPAMWQSGTNVVVDLKWYAAATTNATRWCAQLVCVADAETDDPAFNTAVCVNDTAKGTTLQTNDVSLSLPSTTCSASELLHLKVYRDSDNAADTMTGNASLVGARVTLTRLTP